MHKNNLAQVAGLNSRAFSCLALFPLPRVIKRLFFFFPFLSCFQEHKHRKPCCLIKPGSLQDCQFQCCILHEAMLCLICSECSLHRSRCACAFKTLHFCLSACIAQAWLLALAYPFLSLVFKRYRLYVCHDGVLKTCLIAL